MQSPMPPSPIMPSLRFVAAPPGAHALPFRVVADDEESVEGTASSVDSARAGRMWGGYEEQVEEGGEEGQREGEEGEGENAGPRAAPSSRRPVLGHAEGYEATAGVPVFGTARAFGGCRDVASLRHPSNPANAFTFAVDAEFLGNGANPHS